ncbi:MAG: dihydroorotate dehydrogenase, partial [Parasphingorhabdus sp.]
MDSYKLLRPLLFKLDAETAHHKVLAGFKWASKSKFSLNQIHRIYGSKVPKITVNLMGLQFKNPVGLAAGLDKDAIAGPALAALGFGFIELGTVTPQPQVGNPKPRMFRLQSDQAIINRMGFNSGGLSQFVGNFRRFNTDCISGINLGKNANTPNEDAISDYKAG